jgi:arsenite-transporting ATPase
MGPAATATERSTVREQLSGRLHHRDRSFDEFSSLLAGGRALRPHRLRHGADRAHAAPAQPAQGLERLPGGQRPRRVLPRPALGPEDAGERFKAALAALSDPTQTTVVLVTRPDKGAIAKRRARRQRIARAGLEQPAAGDQRCVPASDRSDAVACAIESWGAGAGADARSRCATAAGPGAAAGLRHGRPARAACAAGRPMPPAAQPLPPPIARRPCCQGPGRAGRRAGRRRARADHGDGQGRRRQDHDCRGAGTRAGAARQDRAPEHHRSGSAPGGDAGRRRAGPEASSRIDPKVETQRYIDKIMAAVAQA